MSQAGNERGSEPRHQRIQTRGGSGEMLGRGRVENVRGIPGNSEVSGSGLAGRVVVSLSTLRNLVGDVCLVGPVNTEVSRGVCV